MQSTTVPYFLIQFIWSIITKSTIPHSIANNYVTIPINTTIYASYSILLQQYCNKLYNIATPSTSSPNPQPHRQPPLLCMLPMWIWPLHTGLPPSSALPASPHICHLQTKEEDPTDPPPRPCPRLSSPTQTGRHCTGTSGKRKTSTAYLPPPVQSDSSPDTTPSDRTARPS